MFEIIIKIIIIIPVSPVMNVLVLLVVKVLLSSYARADGKLPSVNQFWMILYFSTEI